MQTTAINWTVFGSTLAGLFIFGVLYATLVRWVSKKQIVGQTAWFVVVGVTFTMLGFIPMLGVQLVAIILAGFGAAGLPMIVEYLMRVQAEFQHDQNQANQLAKEFLNDSQAPDRQERIQR